MHACIWQMTLISLGIILHAMIVLCHLITDCSPISILSVLFKEGAASTLMYIDNITILYVISTYIGIAKSPRSPN